MKGPPIPPWLEELSPTPVTEDDAREMTANLSEFMSILADWDAQGAPEDRINSASTNDDQKKETP